MIKDGLWCAFCDVHMGGHAEYTAKKAGVTREAQDEFAAQLARKAVAAIEAGKFKAEIAPRADRRSKKGTTTVDTDEGPRKDTTRRIARQACDPRFRARGKNDDLTVTAGNASEPQRRRRRAGRDVGGVREGERPADSRAHRRLRDRGDRAAGSLLRADSRRAEPDEEENSHDRRLRSDRSQRSVRVAGARRRRRASAGTGTAST